MAVVGQEQRKPKPKRPQYTGRPENSIFRVVGLRLKSEGWKVVSELPFHSSAVDGGALKGDEFILIEAKMVLSKKLLHQLSLAQLGSERVLAVIGTMPAARNTGMGWCANQGIGVWLVENEKVIELLPIKKNPSIIYKHYRDRLAGYCREWEESIDGGRPQEKGVGPAIECLKRVTEYRKANPDAAWKEVFRDVPNHYSSFRSMAQSLSFCEAKQRR